MTLRARIALAMALLAGLAALLVGVTTYVATAQRVRAEVDESLKSQAQALGDTDGRTLLQYCGLGAGQPPRGPRPGEGYERLGGVVAQCLDSDGDAVAYSSSVALPIDSADQELAENGGATRTRTTTADGVTYRVTTVPIRYSNSSARCRSPETSPSPSGCSMRCASGWSPSSSWSPDSGRWPDG